MASNLNLELRINAHTSGLTSALNTAKGGITNFSNHATAQASRIGQGFSKLYQQLNGFSSLTKLAAAAGGMALVNDLVQRNLEFEKGLLDMKQTAQMTAAQALEMRKLAIDAASGNMALPSEIMAGIKAFTAAGMKFDQVKASINEAARAAVAFRVPVEAIAKMDFDLQDKLGLDPKHIQASHNMLLYHAKSGRFEPKAMAEEAPKYLNSAKSVGITGLRGLNLVGAMTQQLMKLAPATQPAEVSTFMEHLFGHLTAPQYVKGLAKKGIDIKKFMPKGKFYGEGGVDGLMDFLAAIKKAGLDDPFKLAEAGFREQYTKKAAKQLMDNPEALRNAMREGEDASKTDMVGQDKAEIMDSNYGKMKQSDITKEKKMVGDTANGFVGAWADLNKWAAENPLTAVLAGGGAFFGGRALGKKFGLFGGNGAGGGVLGGVAGSLGVQKVFVTNMGAGFGSDGKPTFRKAVTPESIMSTTTTVATTAGSLGAGVLGGGAALTGAGLAASMAATELLANNPALRKSLLVDSDNGGMLGAMGGDMAFAAAILEAGEAERAQRMTDPRRGLRQMDNDMEAQQAKADVQAKAIAQANKAAFDQLMQIASQRPVQVMLDGRVIAESVNAINNRDARRN